MNKMRLSESERQALLAYMKKTYKYDDGYIVNRKRGKRPRGFISNMGYLQINVLFKGKQYHVYYHRFVWALCNDCWPQLTIDHINGNRLDNRIENLREVSQSENMLNWLLPWKPNKNTGVTGVALAVGRFETQIRGRQFKFHNPHEAFFWGVQCGKRYKS